MLEDLGENIIIKASFAPPLTTLILCFYGLNVSFANMHTIASNNFGINYINVGMVVIT